MLACLWGTFIGFVITAFAFITHSLLFIFIGRVIDGLTCSNQAIAKAAVIDSCPLNYRARTIGWMIFAVTIGVIAGPILGGLFFTQALLHSFSASSPLFIAALLSLMNIVLLMIAFKDPASAIKSDQSIPWLSAFTSIIRGFQSPAIRIPLCSFLLLMIGWTSYQFYTTSYLAQHFQLHGFSNAIFFAAIGVGASFGFLSVGFFENTGIQSIYIVILGYGVLALMILASVLIDQLLLIWLFAIVATFMLAQGYSFMMKLISQQVADDQQGWAMGVASSAAALGTGIALVISAPLASVSLACPLWVDILLIALGLVLLALFSKKPVSSQ